MSSLELPDEIKTSTSNFPIVVFIVVIYFNIGYTENQNDNERAIIIFIFSTLLNQLHIRLRFKQIPSKLTHQGSEIVNGL